MVGIVGKVGLVGNVGGTPPKSPSSEEDDPFPAGEIFDEDFAGDALNEFDTTVNPSAYASFASGKLHIDIPTAPEFEYIAIENLTYRKTGALVNGTARQARKFRWLTAFDGFAGCAQYAPTFVTYSTLANYNQLIISVVIGSDGAGAFNGFSVIVTAYSASGPTYTYFTFASTPASINTGDYPEPDTLDGIEFEFVLEHEDDGLTFYIRNTADNSYLFAPVTLTEPDGGGDLILPNIIDQKVEMILNLASNDQGSPVFDFDDITIENL